MRLGLWANMPRLRARRIREHLELHPEVKLTAEGLHDLTYLETGSKKQAQEAASRQLKEQALRNEPME